MLPNKNIYYWVVLDFDMRHGSTPAPEKNPPAGGFIRSLSNSETHANRIRGRVGDVGRWDRRRSRGQICNHHGTGGSFTVVHGCIELLGEFPKNSRRAHYVGPAQPGDGRGCAALDTDLSAVGVGRNIVRIRRIRWPRCEVCDSDMLPEAERLRVLCGAVVPVALDHAVIVGSGPGNARGNRCGGTRGTEMGVYIAVVTRESFVLVLISIDEQRDRPEVIREVLHLRAVDQFLALEHAAEQQADDHQDDGDFDEGEAALSVHGVVLLFGELKQVKSKNNSC